MGDEDLVRITTGNIPSMSAMACNSEQQPVVKRGRLRIADGWRDRC